MISVREIQAKETYPLRHQVLWPHIALTQECVIDIDDRKDAIHLGSIKNGRVEGICSLFEMKHPRLPEFEKQYRLRAMATSAKVRGEGAGAKIVLHSIDLIRDKGYDVLWCDAREVAVGFYEKLGFKVMGDWYQIPNIGRHKLMYYNLKE